MSLELDWISSNYSNRSETSSIPENNSSLTEPNLSYFFDNSLIRENIFSLTSFPLIRDNDNDPLIRPIIGPSDDNRNTTNSDSVKKKFKLIGNKRGKKKKMDETANKKRRYKLHDNRAIDNLLRKIQVNFLSFILGISNDALKAEFGVNNNYNLKKFLYDDKKKITFEKFVELKGLTIKDVIFQMNISKKYKDFEKNKNVNQKIIDIVCKESKWLKEFFNIKYKEMFQIYFAKKPQPHPHEISIIGKKISLSNNTKCFYHLLEKNKNIENDLISIAENNYLAETNKTSGFYTNRRV